MKIWSPKENDIKSFYFNLNFKSIEDFRSIVLGNFEFNSNYSILLRVGFDKDKAAMLGTQIPFSINKSNYLNNTDELYNKIVERLKRFFDDYKVNYIDSLQILFVKVNLDLAFKSDSNLSLQSPEYGINVKAIKGVYNVELLPLTTNLDYYGKLIVGDLQAYFFNKINEKKKLLLKDLIALDSFDKMFLYNDKYLILIKTIDTNVYLKSIYDINGVFEAEFVDTVLDYNTFNRRFKDTILTVFNNRVINSTTSKVLPIIKNDFLRSRFRRDALVSNPFIGTFDLEAYTYNDVAKVYAAGFCVNNKEPVMFYVKDDNDVLLECLNRMLISKYDGYIFYIHNINYDGVFIIHKLKSINTALGFEFYKIKCLYKDNSILKLEISIAKELSDKRKQSMISARKKPRDIKITFIDSSNLLKGKLHSLCKAFDLEVVKGYFPHDFVKPDTLYYKGHTPSYYYWNDLSLEEYSKLVKSNWDLKEECLYYLSKDLLSLLEIMNLFNKYITRKFDVQMTDSLTISRLSLNIYLKHYLNNSKIPIIKGNLYNDIKEAYFGGVTEVYKPYGKFLFYYDVNSLYPYVALNPMCGNQYSYIESYTVEGLNLHELFGFFYCEIEANPNIYLGLLPVRSLEGLTMPLGKWSGWYFSEEIKFAVENGYKIKVIKGYNFNKEYNVFDDYVKYLYNIKSTTTNSVEKSIMKSLLNNLLGRFGLNINKSITDIVNKDRLDEILTTRECTSFKKITDQDYLITYYPKVSKLICELNGYDYSKILQNVNSKPVKDVEFKDVSLVISAAVTAYARIFMSKIKLDVLKSGGNIYYTDTDSIVTDITLDDKLVGLGLGQFKLEHKIKEAFFISSKTYLLIDELGKHIIKTKGLLNDSLTIDDFYYLYNGYNIKGFKRSARSNYELGSVVIKDESTWLNHDSYKKRTKIFDQDNKWIDTKPLYIGNGSNDVKIKKKPPKIKYNSLNNNLVILFKNTLLLFMAFIIVAFLGYFIEGSILEDILSRNDKISIKRYSLFNNPNKVSAINHSNNTEYKKSIKLFSNRLEVFNFNKTDILNSYKLKYIYNSIVQEILTDNILNNRKFINMDSVMKFSNDYLDSNKFRLTLSQRISILDKLYKIKNENYELYKLICSNDSYENTNRDVNVNTVSTAYLHLYEQWVKDPHSYIDPGNMVVHNRITLLEELEKLNENYSYIIEEYNSIIDDIDDGLRRSRIPRSLDNSPVIHQGEFIPRVSIKETNSNLSPINS